MSCTDERSENAPGQHGGSLQTRFIESMRAHVITIIYNAQGDHNSEGIMSPLKSSHDVSLVFI